MESTLHDIVQGAMIAGIHAERMSKSQPNHAKSLKKFIKESKRIQRELIASVHPAYKHRKK